MTTTDMQALCERLRLLLSGDALLAKTDIARATIEQAIAALASRPDAQADERGAFDVALDALQRYQDEWDTGLPSEYAQSERIQMECACEAVHEALQEARTAAPQATHAPHEKSDLYKEGYLAGKAAARGVPDGWKLVPIEPTEEMLSAIMSDGIDDLYPYIARPKYDALLAATPSREQVGEMEKRQEVTVARMGHGVIAVGECFSPELNEPGIVFLPLEESREPGTDTTDVYCEGVPAPAESVLAYISFANPASVDQTIGVLSALKLKHWPDASPSRECGERQVAAFSDDEHTLMCAVENLRSVERNSEAAFRIAYRLEEMRKRLSASAPTLSEQPQTVEPKGLTEERPSFTNPLTPYGMLVRALRIVAGTTLYDMAKALLTTPAKLSAMEFGRAPVTQELAFDVAAYFDALGVPDTLAALMVAANASALLANGE